MTKVKVKFNSSITTASDGKTASQVNPGTLYFTRGQNVNDTVNQKLFVGGRDYTGVKSVTAGSSAGKINVDGTQVTIPGWDNFIPNSQKGANNGVATLDNSGKVPATQLPSFVDDVIVLVGCYEYNGDLYRPLVNNKLKPNPDPATDFKNTTRVLPGYGVDDYTCLALDYSAHTSDTGLYKYNHGSASHDWTRMTGEGGKIYVENSTGKIYRFADNTFLPIEISASPGTTDEVPEGNTNKYFTEARAQDAVATQMAGKLNKPTVFTSGHIPVLVTPQGQSDNFGVVDGGYTPAQLFGTTQAGHYNPMLEESYNVSYVGEATSLEGGAFKVISNISMDVKNHIKKIYGRNLIIATTMSAGLMSAEDKALIESLYWES